MRTRRSQFSGDPVSRNGPSPLGSSGHRSVLLHESVEALALHRDDIVVDATVGGAGHTKEILSMLDKSGTLIGIDADQDAIDRARKDLVRSKARIHLVTGNFKDLQRILDELGIKKITKVLFDLGWSSYQLDSGRGFSFQKDEPLLMTYAKDGAGVTAATIVNTWSQESIADILYGWGEERYSRRIAKAIIERRQLKRFETARDLGELIKAAVPPAYRHGRIHPATKTFQALRIAVNDELGALKQAIRSAWDRLEVGGRIAVITFHSIEDREVKRLFVELKKEGGELVTKKPLAPSAAEVRENPRARSAKLRTIQKI